MFEQLTLDLDFATMNVTTNERNTNANLDYYYLSA
jgi:hypothetical protein